MSVYKFGGESNKETKTFALSAVLKRIEKDYLKRDGSSGATGPLDMNDNKISRVIDPKDAQDVATKKYVDKREITLEKSKGKDYILVSGDDKKVVETTAKLSDVVAGVSRMLKAKADKISDSKGAGHFVLTHSNGKLVESTVKQEKYSQVHTLLQSEINNLKAKIKNINNQFLHDYWGKIKINRRLAEANSYIEVFKFVPIDKEIQLVRLSLQFEYYAGYPRQYFDKTLKFVNGSEIKSYPISGVSSASVSVPLDITINPMSIFFVQLAIPTTGVSKATETQSRELESNKARNWPLFGGTFRLYYQYI